MNYIVVGLGNPGAEYENTRHNTGTLALDYLESKLNNKKVKLVRPAVFMNQSGAAVKKLITSVKAAEKLIVIHDDLDLPLGRIKISFDRSAGGHRGVGSIIKQIKTQKFIRIRVGISPATPSGKTKKPSGEEKVINFILGKFKPAELLVLKKVNKKIAEAIETIVADGREIAMNTYNQ